MSKASVGFRAHTGWAAAVVLAGSPAAPQVVERRRLNLLAPGVPWECYHAAGAMPRAKAEAMLDKARTTAMGLAQQALREIDEALRSSSAQLSALGVVLANARPLLSLDEALSSHAMKHAAEGQLYRQALMDAARELGLRVVAVPERDLPDAASASLGLTPVVVRGRVGDLGRDIGPPWALDQKTSALVGWLALTSQARRRRNKEHARG